jgi:hypothetical protein
MSTSKLVREASRYGLSLGIGVAALAIVLIIIGASVNIQPFIGGVAVGTRSKHDRESKVSRIDETQSDGITD